MWLIILINILQNTKFRRHFLASQHFSMNNTLHRLTFSSDTFDPSSKTRKSSSHRNHSVHACTKTNDQFSPPNMQSFKDLSSSVPVVLVGHNNAHNISSWKIYHTRASTVALLSTSVESSTWTAYHVWLINSNSCASISSYHFINLSSYSTILKRNVCDLLNCNLFYRFMTNILSRRWDLLFTSDKGILSFSNAVSH